MTNEEIIKYINQMLKLVTDDDNKFLRQICTLFKKHFQRVGRR